MKILQKDKMPNGTAIQLEDWSEDYLFMDYASTIGVYPISKYNSQKQFGPKQGKPFRIDLDFNSQEEAGKAYTDLIEGKTNLLDYIHQMHDKTLIEFI